MDMRSICQYIILLGCLFSFLTLHADMKMDSQRVNDSLLTKFEQGPAVTLFKDNYFITGLCRIKKPLSDNCDVKFQVSFKLRLTKSILPFKTYLFFSYTQKSIWNIYAPSCPFEDNNYNPAFGLGKYVFKDGKLFSHFALMFEHESNGQGRSDSRSWNRLNFHCMFPLNNYLNLQIQCWIPFVKREKYNRDYLLYQGLASLSLYARTPKDRFQFSFTAVKCGNWNFKFNIVTEVAYKVPFLENTFLFAQFCSGYAEYMLRYKEPKNSLRFGICFKPSFLGLQ